MAGDEEAGNIRFESRIVVDGNAFGIDFDAGAGLISMDSPLGRALMRKGLDDEFAIELPGGKKSFVVVGVSYAEEK